MQENIFKRAFKTDKLVSVSLNGWIRSSLYKYKSERKFLGIRTQKAGVYTCFGNYEGIDIPENHTLIDGIIYMNPFVTRRYMDGSCDYTIHADLVKANSDYDSIALNPYWEERENILEKKSGH